MAFQRRKPAALGTKAPYPGFIEPALATEIERVPTDARWIHEIKFDGYRVQVRAGATTGPSASARSPMMPGTSPPPARSSTARWSRQPRMALLISPYCRTN